MAGLTFARLCLQLTNQTRNGLYVLKRTSVFFKRLTEASELYTVEITRVSAERARRVAGVSVLIRLPAFAVSRG
jgi:hypothetical protein